MAHKAYAVRIDELRFDLMRLSEQALRKKYKSESGTHHRGLLKSRTSGWDIFPEWQKLSAYLRDMGPRPSPKHLASFVDPRNKVFGPGSFKWITMAELASQRVGATVIMIEKEPTTVAALADKLGVSGKAIRYALQKQTLNQLIDSSKAPPAQAIDWAYPGPKSQAAFLIGFKAWKSKYTTKDDKRGFIDVYFYLSGLRSLSIIEAKLGITGATDLEDAKQLEAWKSQVRPPALELVFRRYVTARERLGAAFSSIKQRDPDFARSIQLLPGKRNAEEVALRFHASSR